MLLFISPLRYCIYHFAYCSSFFSLENLGRAWDGAVVLVFLRFDLVDSDISCMVGARGGCVFFGRLIES